MIWFISRDFLPAGAGVKYVFARFSVGRVPRLRLGPVTAKGARKAWDELESRAVIEFEDSNLDREWEARQNDRCELQPLTQWCRDASTSVVGSIRRLIESPNTSWFTAAPSAF